MFLTVAEPLVTVNGLKILLDMKTISAEHDLLSEKDRKECYLRDLMAVATQNPAARRAPPLSEYECQGHPQG